MKQWKSVVKAGAVKGPAWLIGEPSKGARLEVHIWSAFSHPCHFSALQQAGQRLAHDVKQSKPVDKAGAVACPAWLIADPRLRPPSEGARLEVCAGPVF